MKILIRVLAVALILSVQLIYADGPILGSDKLYSEGPVVLLRLTKEQKIFLEKDHKSQIEGALRLTPEQTKKIENGFKIRTTLLEVWDTRKADTDCSCASSNIALRFSEDYIEVLQPYLLTDKEAIEKWKSWDQTK
jgi:hypothetical protein